MIYRILIRWATAFTMYRAANDPEKSRGMEWIINGAEYLNTVDYLS